MKTLKNALLVALALSTVGGAVLAWRQYQELVVLRASTLASDERATWQKRLWDSEKANRELNDQLAALRTPDAEVESMVTSATAGRPAGRGQSGATRGVRGGVAQQAILELMNRPEVQTMIQAQRKLAIEQQYAGLFKSLNLTPEQAEKLKVALIDRQLTLQDVRGAAREAGLDPRSNPEAMRKLVADAQSEIDNSIRAAIGDAGLAQLQYFERTTAQRSVVQQLQQRLDFSGSPLSTAQTEQLVQILAATTPPRATPANATPLGNAAAGAVALGARGELGALAGAFLGGGGTGAALENFRAANSVPITPEALTQAQSVLSPPQFATFQQLQQQQQAAQQIRQLVGETLQANPSATGGRGGGAGGRRGGGG